MIGKLFNLAPGSIGVLSAQDAPPSAKHLPESVQEDSHTRSLLFPDNQALYARQDQVFPLPIAPSASQPSSSAREFDYDDNLEIDVRDVRVIVMQDSLGSVNPSLLFDSHPGPSVPPSSDRQPAGNAASHSLARDLRRNPTSPRTSSISHSPRPLIIQPDSLQSRSGAFDRRAPTHTRSYSQAETEVQREAREHRDEISSFSSCIFANSEVMSYKGTQTKVHIVPSESRHPDIHGSYHADGRGSVGRSHARSTRLAQSYVNAESAGGHNASSHFGTRLEDRKVLITRLFPVNLPTEEPDTPTTGATPHSRLSEDGGGFPFPPSVEEATPKKKKPQPKQKRTPMYAVALVLRLPGSPGSHAPSSSRPAFRGPSSYTERGSFSSSYNSMRRAGWSMIGSGYGNEMFDSAHSMDGEDSMDTITQHWDVIMRTLTHLQSVVATRLFPMLKQVDSSVPDPATVSVSAQMARSSSISRRGSNGSQIKPPKSNAKLVALSPNCLMHDQHILRQIDAARIRIVSGLRATRVVTGQGRWGPWREEARWVARWAGGKEQGFFFFTLLTGFLSIHTDWLQALSPLWYRKRHYQQQKAMNEEDTSLPQRTVIVSRNKIAARRLVFLLSAFLPANQQMPTIRSHRPSTSASYSQSPPSYIVPIAREESLRRKMNRRPVGNRGHSHARSFSIQSQATTRSATGIPAQLAHLSMDSQQGRRSSDATLSRNVQLPMQGSDLSTRKSSAATTNTVTPEAPVPHFTTIHRTNTVGSRHRPGSSGSMAADDLKRSLRRGDSVGHSSIASSHSRSRGSNWGSVMSGLGLWSSKRDSATSTSQTLDSFADTESPFASPTKRSLRERQGSVASGADPSVMFRRTELDSEVAPSTGADDPVDGKQPQDKPLGTDRQGLPDRPLDPSAAFESPVKTSINDDGIIDVEVQFPDYLTSFESAVSSPSSSGYLSAPGFGNGLDGFEQSTRIAVDGDSPLNAAGWLPQFHPDFSLQAVPPDDGLEASVIAALKAEPTPPAPHHSLPVDWPTERWVDVSTAIIADTTNFTVKRLRYRRLIKPKSQTNRGSGSFGPGLLHAPNPALMTPALSPYEQPIEEKIEEEIIVAVDELLTEAVERVIAHSNEASKLNSATSSRSGSKRRERSGSEVSKPEESEGPRVRTEQHVHQVPRVECKTVVLSALGEIVQNLVEEREKEGHRAAPVASFGARDKESALRQAVRDWLVEVEARDL